MSFSRRIKLEICEYDFSKIELISLLSGYIRAMSGYNKTRIEIFTENSEVANFISSAIEKVFLMKPNIFYKNGFYITCDEAKEFLKTLSILDEKEKYLRLPKDYITGDNSLTTAYLMGTFLARGSINDPKTSTYHLEFLLDKKGDVIIIQRLLNRYNLNARMLKRGEKYMVYIKEAEKISDFMKLIKVSASVLYFESERVYREEKNSTNRLNNMEQANVERSIQAANKRIKKIHEINKHSDLLELNEKMKETMDYRLRYPEASLKELSEIITQETGKKLTKSGLNHRLRKIDDEYNHLKIKLRRIEKFKKNN